MKQVNGSSGVTVNASGGAAFDRVGGVDSTSLSGTQSVMMQYNAASNVWHIMATTSTIVVDTTASDFQMNGTAAAGSVGKIADAGHVHPTDTSRAEQLTVRSVQTAAFGPAGGDFVPYNISGGSICDVLPNAPANGTVVAVKLAIVQSSPIGSSSSAGTLNSLTISTQGADTFSDGVSTTHDVLR